MLGKEKERPFSLRRRACPERSRMGLRAAQRSAIEIVSMPVSPTTKLTFPGQNVCTVTLTFNYTPLNKGCLTTLGETPAWKTLLGTARYLLLTGYCKHITVSICASID